MIWLNSRSSSILKVSGDDRAAVPFFFSFFYLPFLRCFPRSSAVRNACWTFYDHPGNLRLFSISAGYLSACCLVWRVATKLLVVFIWRFWLLFCFHHLIYAKLYDWLASFQQHHICQVSSWPTFPSTKSFLTFFLSFILFYLLLCFLFFSSRILPIV